MASMGEFQGENHCWPKWTQRSISHLPWKHLDDPQDFWENILWTDETKVELFARCVSRYTRSKTNTAFQKKKHYTDSQTWWWWCDGLGLLCCFRTRTTCRNWFNHEFCSSQEHLGGECPAISLWPSAQAHLKKKSDQVKVQNLIEMLWHDLK